MNETLPMPTDLLKKGREKARARTEIFVKQEPKEDGAVFPIDAKTITTPEPVSPDTSNDTEDDARKAIAPVAMPPVADAAAKSATDAIDVQNVKDKNRRNAQGGENSAESDEKGERLKMEYLYNFKEERLKILDAIGSIEDFRSRPPKYFSIDLNLLADISKKHSVKTRSLYTSVRDEIRKAYNDKKKELQEKARKAKKYVEASDAKKEEPTSVKRNSSVSSDSQKIGQEELNPEESQKNLVAMYQKQDEAREEDSPASSSQNNIVTPQQDTAEERELERQQVENESENDRLASVRAENEARLQELQKEEGSIVDSSVAETLDKAENLPVKLAIEVPLVVSPENKSILELESESRKEVINPEKEAEQASIDGLRTLVGEFRAAYVKEDVEATTTWKKLKSILGIERDTEKGGHQKAYETALQNLQNAEMNMMRSGMAEDGKTLSSQGIQEGAERLLRYYKLDESRNLINERTQYKAQNQSFSEKIVDSLGTLGRQYNSIPFTRKMMYAGIFAGLGIAGTLSGGTAAGALASVIFARRVAAGLGTAVATEAGLEKLGDWQRSSKAEKEIKEQLRMLGKESLGAKPEVTFDALNILLDEDIASLNTKLQNEKRAKTWRKLGAVGIGSLIGSGWLAQTVMEETGAGEWIKNKTDTLFTSQNMVPNNDQGGKLPPIARHDIVDSPAEKAFGILDKVYTVQKGDSVWKIAGHAADELHLKGPGRTYFIDAIKDRYGDVPPLKTGETITFSSKGVNKVFIDTVLEKMKALSSDQLTSIASNDAKIAEYVASHPGTTLNNAVVDQILHGETLPKVDAVTLSNGTAFQTADTLGTQGTDGNLSSEASDASKNAVEQAIRENRAFTDPKTYLAEHPGDISRFNSTLGRIRMNIFMMNTTDAGTPPEYDYALNNKLGATKISDVLNDLSRFDNWGLQYDRELNPLHYDQMKDIAKFTEASKVAFGEEFSQVEAGENIDSYTRRMATAALRTGKEIKGFFKP